MFRGRFLKFNPLFRSNILVYKKITAANAETFELRERERKRIRFLSSRVTTILYKKSDRSIYFPLVVQIKIAKKNKNRPKRIII